MCEITNYYKKIKKIIYNYIYLTSECYIPEKKCDMYLRHTNLLLIKKKLLKKYYKIL